MGLYKKAKGLPSVDEAREAEQAARIEMLAKMDGLDVPFLQCLFRRIIDRVVVEHEALKKQG